MPSDKVDSGHLCDDIDNLMYYGDLSLLAFCIHICYSENKNVFLRKVEYL